MTRRVAPVDEEEPFLWTERDWQWDKGGLVALVRHAAYRCVHSLNLLYPGYPAGLGLQPRDWYEGRCAAETSADSPLGWSLVKQAKTLLSTIVHPLQIIPVGAGVAKRDACSCLSHPNLQFSKAVQTQVHLQLETRHCPVDWPGKRQLVLLPTEAGICPGSSVGFPG